MNPSLSSNEELWQTVLAQIQLDISKANFTTWFADTRIIDNNNGEIIVATPNSFAKEWLEKRYQGMLLKILRSCNPAIRLISFVVEPPSKSINKTVKEKSYVLKQESCSENQLQLPDIKANPKTNLNPYFTFDNFVVGSFNELAHAAAWAISEKPGKDYNPLFIYGDVGLGKTHLLQAIGNRLIKNFPELKVIYTPAERFITKIIEAIRNQEIEHLKRKLTLLDVLIIDDVQFFAGKEKTQEEFFHIYNNLYQNQKQIVFSSDRPPSAIPAIADRLRSRFEGGMVADIGTPDLETKIAILKTKCDEKEIVLNEDILMFIASNVQKNIRELEGALNRLIIHKKTHQKNPDIELAKKLLKPIMVIPKKATNFKKIIQAVSSFYGVSFNELFLPTRKKEIVKPRQIAMYLLRSELKESYPAIGRRFQGKDHTTAIYAYEKISQQIEENQEVYQEINSIKQMIYND